ncbi:MAG: AI-2E family transporter [Verrucomicrobiales bacterium]
MTSLTIWIDGTMDSLGNFADRFSPGDPSVATTPPLETKRELLSFREIFDRYWDSSIILDFLGQSALVGKVTSLLTKAFFVFVVMIFVLAESGRYADKVRAVLEAKGPDLGRFHRSAADLQKYLGIKTAVSAATGLLAWLSCSLIGVDFPILWGLIAFVFNYIPAIGSVVAAVPPVILALVQLDGLWGGGCSGHLLPRYQSNHRDHPGAHVVGQQVWHFDRGGHRFSGFLGLRLGTGGNVPCGAFDHGGEGNARQQCGLEVDFCADGERREGHQCAPFGPQSRGGRFKSGGFSLRRENFLISFGRQAVLIGDAA